MQATEIDKNIEHLGKIAMDQHTTVVQLNSEFDYLIETMEAAGARQLNEIIMTLREISIDYKHLERKTRSAISRTAYVVSEVARTASHKKLKPHEKIVLMKRDFASLSNEFDTLSWRHTGIREQLATQAEKAEAAKEENDRRTKKAEEMKEYALACGIAGVPGVGFVASVAGCSMAAVESVDHSALKVLAGVAGALGGVVAGAVVIAGSPILLGISAALAIKSKLWSAKFDSMHDMIRQLEDIMELAARHLSNIDSNLNALGEQISQVDPNDNNRVLNEEFRRIQRICEKVSEICTQYEQLADSKTKRIKQIDKPRSE